MKNVGVYKITNIKNNKVYVGSSKNLRKRRYDHFEMLKLNKHHSIYLQRAYNKSNNKNDFVFEVLEYCNEKDLLVKEQYWLNSLCKADEYINKINNDFLKLSYNILPKAIKGFGGRHRLETILKFKMNNPFRKNILCYNQNGTLYGKFNSSFDAQNATKVSKGSILKLCKNKTYIGRTFIFGFENDVNFLDFINNSEKPIIYIPPNKGKKLSSDEINKLPQCTKITATDTISKKVMYFNSQKEACKYFNLQPCTINRCLKNNKPYKRKLLFEYYDIVRSS